MSRILLLLTLAALTGGCIGNDKSSDTGEAQYVEPGQKAASTPAPVELEEAPMESTTEPVAWDGRAPVFGLTCVSRVDSCVLHLGGEMFTAYELPQANWTHALLNLTWTSTLPGQKLAVGVYGWTPGCEDAETLGDYVNGPSPLGFDMPLLPATPEYPVVRILVWTQSHVDQDPIFAYASPEQPFNLEGEIHGWRE